MRILAGNYLEYWKINKCLRRAVSGWDIEFDRFSLFSVLYLTRPSKLFQWRNPKMRRRVSKVSRTSELFHRRFWRRCLNTASSRTSSTSCVATERESLLRKNFSFYASKEKFKKLKYCRNLCFVDGGPARLVDGALAPGGPAVSSYCMCWPE